MYMLFISYETEIRDRKNVGCNIKNEFLCEYNCISIPAVHGMRERYAELKP